MIAGKKKKTPWKAWNSVWGLNGDGTGTAVFYTVGRVWLAAAAEPSSDVYVLVYQG